MKRIVHDHTVRGLDVDAATRCGHYHTKRDVIAIRFACCETYYPCFQCHDTLVDHDTQRIPPERFDEPAVLCGVCGTELSVRQYLDCDDACPDCSAPFNPNCATHASLYFDLEGSSTAP